MFKFSVCAPLAMTLYTKNEVDKAINNLKQVAEFTTVWLSADFQDDVPADDLEGQAFLNCKIIETEIDPDAPKIKLYTELKDEIIPGAQMTGQVMARLISFPKAEWQLFYCADPRFGKLHVCCLFKGHSVQERSSHHDVKEIFSHEDLSVPCLLCQIPEKNPGPNIW